MVVAPKLDTNGIKIKLVSISNRKLNKLNKLQNK